MRREKLAVSPWDRRVLMALLPKGALNQLRFIREENPAVKSKPKLFTWEWAATSGIFSICCCVPSPWRLVLRPGRARLPGNMWQGQADGAVTPYATHEDAVSLGQRLFPLGRGHTQCHIHSREKATPQHKHQTPRGCRTEHGHAIGHRCASRVLPGPPGSDLSSQILSNLLVPQGAEHLLFPRCLQGEDVINPRPCYQAIKTLRIRFDWCGFGS